MSTVKVAVQVVASVVQNKVLVIYCKKNVLIEKRQVLTHAREIQIMWIVLF